jgi:hypothetical protein
MATPTHAGRVKSPPPRRPWRVVNPWLWPALLAVVLAVAACGGAQPAASPATNPAAAPPDATDPAGAIVCTPPPCAADETYACGSLDGNCPGGCGTMCVKAAPEPAARPGPDNPYCDIVVRAPPVEAPTASVLGTPQPDKRIDPHVAVCASADQLRVGAELVLVGHAVDIGLPLYQLNVRDAGADGFAPLLRWVADDQVQVQTAASALLEPIAWRLERYDPVIVLKAIAPGAAELRLSASGEVHWGYPGPATWSGGTSDILTIRIEQ